MKPSRNTRNSEKPITSLSLDEVLRQARRQILPTAKLSSDEEAKLLYDLSDYSPLQKSNPNTDSLQSPEQKSPTKRQLKLGPALKVPVPRELAGGESDTGADSALPADIEAMIDQGLSEAAAAAEEEIVLAQTEEFCRGIIDQIFDGLEYNDDLDDTGTGKILPQPALVIEAIADKGIADAIIDVETLSVEANLSVVAAYPRVEPIMMNLSSQRFNEAIAAMRQGIRSGWEFHETFTGAALSPLETQLPPLETQANIGSLSLVVYRGQQARLSETDADTFQSLLPYSTQGWQVQKVQVTTSDFVKERAQKILQVVKEIKLDVVSFYDTFFNDFQKRMRKLRLDIQKHEERIQRRDAKIQQRDEYIVFLRKRVLELETVVVEMRRKSVTQLVHQIMPTKQTTSVQIQVEANDFVQAATDATATVANTTEQGNVTAAVTNASDRSSMQNTHGFTGVCMLSVWCFVLVAISAWNGAFNSLAAWMGFVCILAFTVSTMKTGLIRFINEYRKPEIERGLLAVEVLHKWGKYTEYLQDCIAQKELKIERKYAKRYEKMQKDLERIKAAGGVPDRITLTDACIQTDPIADDNACIVTSNDASTETDPVPDISFEDARVETDPLTKEDDHTEVNFSTSSTMTDTEALNFTTLFFMIYKNLFVIPGRHIRTGVEFIASGMWYVVVFCFFLMSQFLFAGIWLIKASFTLLASFTRFLASFTLRIMQTVKRHVCKFLRMLQDYTEESFLGRAVAVAKNGVASGTKAMAFIISMIQQSFRSIVTFTCCLASINHNDLLLTMAVLFALVSLVIPGVGVDRSIILVLSGCLALLSFIWSSVPVNKKIKRDTRRETVFEFDATIQPARGSVEAAVQVGFQAGSIPTDEIVVQEAEEVLETEVQKNAVEQAEEVLQSAVEQVPGVAVEQAEEVLQSAVEQVPGVAVEQAEEVLQSAVEQVPGVAVKQAEEALEDAVEQVPGVALEQAQEVLQNTVQNLQPETTTGGTEQQANVQEAKALETKVLKRDAEQMPRRALHQIEEVPENEITSFLTRDKELSMSFTMTRLTRHSPQFKGTYSQEMHPCMQCCDFMRSLFLAEQILQSKEFIDKNAWAAEFDHKKHRIWINSTDLDCLYYNVIAGVCVFSAGVMAWLLAKQRHYGYVFREREFVAQLFEGPISDELDARVSRYTTDESMKSYKDLQASGAYLTNEEENLVYFPMARRTCFLKFLESSAAGAAATSTETPR